jgi:glyoxylase-like metal-dependent hydrolase (beta-lactamase superfamily II)
MGEVNSFNSRRFQLEQLADGVYAAIHAFHDKVEWAGCNAGIIDLGDRTIVFDSFEILPAAKDLRAAAETLTGRPVHAVINSHYHNDHIWGNQVFYPDTDIISTPITRDLIATEGMNEVQWYRDEAQKQLDVLKVRYSTACDQSILATLPELHVCLPNLTFTGSLIFNGSKRSAELIAYEGGHCGSDAILYLPDDGVVFMEDLLFIDMHPYLPDGNPYEIKHILDHVRKLQAETFVPGHGRVGKIADLDWMDAYIDTLDELVREAIEHGATEADIEKLAMPENYQTLIFPSFFRANMKFLYQKQITSRAGSAQ